MINWNRMNLNTNRLRCFLRRLILASRIKKKYISCQRFRQCDWFLYYLFEMGLIKNYKINDRAKFTVEIAYDKHGNSVIHGIKWLVRNKIISHQKFRKILIKLKNKMPIYAFVDTRWGYIPLSVCVKERISGYIILWIY